MSAPTRIPFGFGVHITNINGKLCKMLFAKCFCGHCQYVHADWNGSLIQAVLARMWLRVRQKWDVEPKFKCAACKHGGSVEVGLTHAQKMHVPHSMIVNYRRKTRGLN